MASSFHVYIGFIYALYLATFLGVRINPGKLEPCRIAAESLSLIIGVAYHDIASF